MRKTWPDATGGPTQVCQILSHTAYPQVGFSGKGLAAFIENATRVRSRSWMLAGAGSFLAPLQVLAQRRRLARLAFQSFARGVRCG